MEIRLVGEGGAWLSSARFKIERIAVFLIQTDCFQNIMDVIFI